MNRNCNSDKAHAAKLKFLSAVAGEDLSKCTAGPMSVDELVNSILLTAPRMARMVIKTRYGLANGEPLSHEETVKILAQQRNPERVQRLEADGMSALRRPENAKRIREKLLTAA